MLKQFIEWHTWKRPDKYVVNITLTYSLKLHLSNYFWITTSKKVIYMCQIYLPVSGLV